MIASNPRLFNYFFSGLFLLIGTITLIYAFATERLSDLDFFDGFIALFFVALLLVGIGRITGRIFGWFRRILTPKKDEETKAALRDLEKHDAFIDREQQLVEQDASVLRHLRLKILRRKWRPSFAFKAVSSYYTMFFFFFRIWQKYLLHNAVCSRSEISYAVPRLTRD